MICGRALPVEHPIDRIKVPLADSFDDVDIFVGECLKPRESREDEKDDPLGRGIRRWNFVLE